MDGASLHLFSLSLQLSKRLLYVREAMCCWFPGNILEGVVSEQTMGQTRPGSSDILAIIPKLGPCRGSATI